MRFATFPHYFGTRDRFMRKLLNKREFSHWLPEQIRQHALERGNKIALRNELDHEISYRELFKSSIALADRLKGSDTKSVALFFKDPIKLAIAILGTWYSNKTAVPLHFSYPIEEISHRLDTSSSGLILTDSRYPVLEPLKIDKLNINSHMNSKTNEAYAVKSDGSPALILFTSGTTGKPKGVVHSFEGLNEQLSDLQEAWNMSSNDELFLTLPLNHIHGLITGMFNGLFAGAGVTLHSQFDAQLAWNRLSNSKTSFFTAVPAIYSKLYQHFRSKKPSNIDHLRLMISGSSSLSESLLNAWGNDVRRAGIIERYGMTETGMIATNAIDAPLANCVGKPFSSVEIKIDTTETDNRFGHILVKGPGLFDGYLTSSGSIYHDKNTFFRTGDQGYFTEEGNLVLVGRDRDILKVNGFKVGCGEIESAILSHSGVQECSVVGLSDPSDSSNQIVAALVVSDDKSIINLLRGHLSSRLAHYKIPRRWIVSVKGIPRNLIGKPDHKAIVDLFIEK